MVSASNASHIGSALSIADIIAILYEKILNYIYKNHHGKIETDLF